MKKKKHDKKDNRKKNDVVKNNQENVAAKNATADENDLMTEDLVATQDSVQDNVESEIVSAEPEVVDDNVADTEDVVAEEAVVVEGNDSEEMAKESEQPSDEKEKTIFQSVEKCEQSNLKDESDFADFLKEFGVKLSEWMRQNSKICMIALFALIVLVIAVTVIKLAASGDGQMAGGSVSGQDGTATTTSVNDISTVPQEPLLENAYPEVNAVVQQYFTAMQNNDIATIMTLKNYVDSIETTKIEVKSHYVEAYENIVCYTKPGPFENSYIVYVSYDVRMYDWDVVAPSLQTLLVCTNEDGSLYLYSGDFDENIAAYISSISSQTDVVDLITKVDTQYNEVLDANVEFAEYMNALNQMIKNEIGEVLAAEATVSDPNTVSESEVQEVTQDEPEPEEEEETSFEVVATTTVYVRMSDSAEADALGKITSGTVLTCEEEQPNGWSRVIYEGETGYVKSEYLNRVDNDGDTTVQTTGTVRVSETVNIRAEAGTDSEQLGVAYAGESFSLVEHLDNGWTRILYNGREAYVKTEFIED